MPSWDIAEFAAVGVWNWAVKVRSGAVPAIVPVDEFRGDDEHDGECELRGSVEAAPAGVAT